MMTAEEKAREIAAALAEKKGEDILVLDVAEKTVIAERFVLASGRSTTQVRALVRAVEEKLEKLDVPPLRKEGADEGKWAVLDCGDVIVHVFTEEQRKFYRLERLWSDGSSAGEPSSSER